LLLNPEHYYVRFSLLPKIFILARLKLHLELQNFAYSTSLTISKSKWSGLNPKQEESQLRKNYKQLKQLAPNKALGSDGLMAEVLTAFPL
jgi:hypothetical protein